MVTAAERHFGRLDVMFNNAGIMHSDDDDAVSTEEKIWDLTMDINAKGVFLGCKYGIPALRRAGGGSIINTASFVALLGAATPAGGLHGLEGCGAGHDQGARRGPRPGEHPGQCPLPGPAPHRAPDEVPRHR